MKQKTKIILISIFTIIMFLAFCFVMIKMIKENGNCADDPFKYAAIKLEESGGKYFCSCESLDPNLLDFNFNSEGITILDRRLFNTDNLNLNIDLKGG